MSYKNREITSNKVGMLASSEVPKDCTHSPAPEATEQGELVITSYCYCNNNCNSSKPSNLKCYLFSWVVGTQTSKEYCCQQNPQLHFWNSTLRNKALITNPVAMGDTSLYPRPAHLAACQTSVPKGTQLNILLTQPVSSLQATPTRTSTQPRVRLQLNECAAGARLHTPIRLRQRHPLSSVSVELPPKSSWKRHSSPCLPTSVQLRRRRSPGLWQHAATGFPAFSPNGFPSP